MGSGAVAWLELWERAAPGPPRRRRRELLAFAGLPAGRSAEKLEIGRANARLLHLYRDMFGPRLSCQTACPACDEPLELEIDIGELLARDPGRPAEPARLEVGEWEITFRLPAEGDLDAIQDEGDPEAARGALLRRCVTACRSGAEVTSASLAPPEVTARVVELMEDADPLAVLDFALRCGCCGHAWSSALDVGAFLWVRLDAWVRRLLHDVHTLAKVYGWSERAIAEMSPWKRQIYLDMVDG